eukprot:TRINITY_DN379_c0_g2_i1.p1 TRINITY_DN379_c0_g2~~TRINITY_DN379_c0_g2_i1.p1  ORF type:complete len:252 (-),score=36.67 TRINITY_DN379_c0_g2_i1:58-813(-)
MKKKTIASNGVAKKSNTGSQDSWLKIQALSGAFFGLFAVVHLLNHAVAHLGVETYTNVQHKLRTVYQNPIVEALIFASLGVHMLSNTILITRRWKREADPKAVRSLTLSQKLQRWSGYFLATVIFGHIFATRFQQTLFNPELDGDFALATYTLVYNGAFFFPYYFLLGSLSLFHSSYGFLKAFDMILGIRSHKKITESGLFYFLMTLGSAGVMSILLAFAGYYFDVQSPRVDMWVRHYDYLYSLVGIKASH